MDVDVWAQTVKVIPWTLILQVSLIAILGMVAKKYYDNISSYYMFRANKDLGKNVKVIVDGRPGIITQFTWRFIYVKVEDTGNELIIPISRWTIYTWEICKNGHNKKEDK